MERNDIFGGLFELKNGTNYLKRKMVNSHKPDMPNITWNKRRTFMNDGWWLHSGMKYFSHKYFRKRKTRTIEDVFMPSCK